MKHLPVVIESKGEQTEVEKEANLRREEAEKGAKRSNKCTIPGICTENKLKRVKAEKLSELERNCSTDDTSSSPGRTKSSVKKKISVKKEEKLIFKVAENPWKKIASDLIPFCQGSQNPKEGHQPMGMGQKNLVDETNWKGGVEKIPANQRQPELRLTSEQNSGLTAGRGKNEAKKKKLFEKNSGKNRNPVLNLKISKQADQEIARAGDRRKKAKIKTTFDEPRREKPEKDESNLAGGSSNPPTKPKHQNSQFFLEPPVKRGSEVILQVRGGNDGPIDQKWSEKLVKTRPEQRKLSTEEKGGCLNPPTVQGCQEQIQTEQLRTKQVTRAVKQQEVLRYDCYLDKSPYKGTKIQVENDKVPRYCRKQSQ